MKNILAAILFIAVIASCNNAGNGSETTPQDTVNVNNSDTMRNNNGDTLRNMDTTNHSMDTMRH